jgi:hypothetical protein
MWTDGHTGGRKERYNEANSRFSQFSKHAYRANSFIQYSVFHIYIYIYIYTHTHTHTHIHTVWSRFTTGLRSRTFGCKSNCRKTSII